MKRLLFFFVLLSSVSLFSQPVAINDSLTFINSTFLGGPSRSYYGNLAPDSLKVHWKTYLGEGKTTISRKTGDKNWAGAGWTGQPLLIKERNQFYLIQGAFDHHLKKLDAKTGKIIWEYDFDDVVKGTGTIWYNPYARTKEESILIFQGSRLGYGKYLDNLHIPSYRCISYYTGNELWRLDVKQSASYSRDVDASCLIINDTLYIGLENSWFTLIDPRPDHAIEIDSMIQPKTIQQHLLYTSEDVHQHRSNVVTEGSIGKFQDYLFIPSGSGRLWCYHLNQKKLIWNFFIGSDIDGSAIITEEGDVFVSVEKQYIEGNGGVFLLSPQTDSVKVKWYFPTPNTNFAGWEGGVIGSVGINDQSNLFPDIKLAVFSGIDSLMYVVDYNSIDSTTFSDGPNNQFFYPKPKLLFQWDIGRSISTPLILGNKIVACSYNGIYLFEIYPDKRIELIDYLNIGEVEATPFVYDKRIYVASRNGYLYCLGN